MTLAEFQQLFLDIQTALTNLVSANVDTGVVKVIGRDVFDEDEAEWMGRLVGPTGLVRCWSIYSTGCAGLEDERNPVSTETFVPTYNLIGYHYYDFGTTASNSAKSFQNELNKLRWAFMQDQSLGLPSYVESHTGFINRLVLGRIDSKPVHIARVELGVRLHPIAYEYDGS